MARPENPPDPLRIAVVGARGIPARYSGFDSMVHELAPRMAALGHQVTVYCRRGYYPSPRPRSWKGVRLVHLPAPRLKGLESLFHTLLSSLHLLFHKADVVYLLDPGNAPFLPLLKAGGRKVVVHTDGLGWKRRKWSKRARAYYKWVEGLAAKWAHALVTDNPYMQIYYKTEYNADSWYLPYGAKVGDGEDPSVYDQYRLEPEGYLLVVARLEPENNVDVILAEHKRSRTPLPLVVVGDSPYNPVYLEYLQALAREDVLFTGRIHDQEKLNALYAGAHLYLHGHEVGGTNPSLLRALAAGTPPLYLEVPFNQAVAGDAGIPFTKEPGHLARLLDQDLTPQEREEKSRLARTLARTQYDWEAIVQGHLAHFRDLLARDPSGRTKTYPVPARPGLGIQGADPAGPGKTGGSSPDPTPSPRTLPNT